MDVGNPTRNLHLVLYKSCTDCWFDIPRIKSTVGLKKQKKQAFLPPSVKFIPTWLSQYQSWWGLKYQTLITALALVNRSNAVKAKCFLLTCWCWRHWQDVIRRLAHFPQCVGVWTHWIKLYTAQTGQFYCHLGRIECFCSLVEVSLSIAPSSPFLFLCWVLLVWFGPDAFAPSPGDGPSEGVAPAAATDACAGSGGCSSLHKIL